MTDGVTSANVRGHDCDHSHEVKYAGCAERCGDCEGKYAYYGVKYGDYEVKYDDYGVKYVYYEVMYVYYEVKYGDWDENYGCDCVCVTFVDGDDVAVVVTVVLAG